MTTMVSRSILTLKQDDLLPIPTPARFSLIVYDFPQDFGDFSSRDEAMEMVTEELTEKIWLAGVTAGPISGRMCLNRIGKSDPTVMGAIYRNPACNSPGPMFNGIILPSLILSRSKH
jgi:hypothetical protein